MSLTTEERRQIIKLVRTQVVPAIGCTEPMCVALCTAKATQVLGVKPPDSLQISLSANILKNALGVGIPGTDGLIGLPIAVALGAVCGNPDGGLEVLKHITSDYLKQAKTYVNEKRIQLSLKEGITEKLYVEVIANSANGHTSRAVISGSHTRFVRVEKDNEVLFSLSPSDEPQDNQDICLLNMRRVYDFSMSAPIDEIDFILEARRLNENAADQSLQACYGHELGKTLSRPMGRGIMGDHIFSHILSRTALACDARMAGAMVPIMSNSGSGNQGICATIPVTCFARENHNTEDELVRALMLSHLTAIYIKQSLGVLSALCGCVVASTGSACGITYLMGGGYTQICAAVKNMIANLTGMICDGAKPSCVLKLTSGVSTAVLSAMLAMQNKCVSCIEGIIDQDVDRSIHNLTIIGRESMNETDRRVLDIMTHKSCP